MKRETSSQMAVISLPLVVFISLIVGICVSSGMWFAGIAVGLLFYARQKVFLLSALGAVGVGIFLGSMALKPTENPLRAFYGQKVSLNGYWDGQALSLTHPSVSVVLSPKPKAASGRLQVWGVLGDPAPQKNFFAFDYGRWLKLQGIQSVLYNTHIEFIQEEKGFRQWFENGLHVGLGESQGALMEALELGDRAEVSQLPLDSAQVHRPTDSDSLSIRDAFTRAGLAHLMALSGQHVAILVGVFSFVLLPLGLWRYPVLLLLLLAYIGFVGFQPSIVRAVLQGGAVLFSLWLGRGKLDLLGTLSLAGTLSLLFSPLWVFDVGFQLSYLAVLGLWLGHHAAKKWSFRAPKWIQEGLLMTVASSLTTLPLIAHYFGQIPWVALPANLLCGPLMVVLVPLGLLSGILGPWAQLLNAWVVSPLTDLLLFLVKFFSKAEPIVWGNISWAGFVLYGLWFWALLLWISDKIRLLQFGALSSWMVLCSFLPAQASKDREIVYLDVGQGDSSLVRVGKFSMLIDGGGTPRGDFDVGSEVVIPALRSFGVFGLDVVVATHADSDHIEGLISVLKRLPVREMWIGDLKEGQGDAVLDRLLEVAHQRDVRVRVVRKGDGFRVSDVHLDILSPGHLFEEDNANSVALRLTRGNFRTVFLGDMPTPLEEGLGVGRLDVLKLAHHGSRYSSSDLFLSQTQPNVAVVSVGKNGYGHPSQDVLKRLEDRKIKVIRTDVSGAIRLTF